MSFSRFVVAGLLVSTFAALAGCSAESKGEEDVAATESDLKLSGTRYLGRINSGETKSGYYYAPPTYRSYGFDAKGGDEITVDVKSVYGDGMGWITDSSYNVLAFNDDASGSTLDAKVKYKVPTGQATKSYRIVFRDYDLLEATFNVSLSIRSAETCNPATETWRNYVGTPQQCMVIRYSCPSNRVPFSNSCGCGCELPQ